MALQRTVATALVVALLTAVAAPAAMAATTGLAVSTTQDATTGDATVSVTRGDDPVANATVVVEANESYDGTGTYETDANGTVGLPAPAETVEVTVTANESGENATATTTLAGAAAFELGVAATQDDVTGTTTVSVTRGDDPVENATVVVEADESYAGNGTYQTDAEGTVSLPAPEASVNLTVTASDAGQNATTTVTLAGDEAFELGVSVAQAETGEVTVSVTRGDAPVENATVVVESDESYAGNGTYQTDANGAVALPKPDKRVEVTVTASDAGESATTTATLSPAERVVGFGMSISEFVQRLIENGERGIGPQVSDFATENNPGQGPPDHAGPPEDKSGDDPGKSGDDADAEDEEEEQGEEQKEDEEEDEEEQKEEQEENEEEEEQEEDEEEEEQEEDEEQGKEREQDDVDGESDASDDERGDDSDDGDGPGRGNGPPDHANN